MAFPPRLRRMLGMRVRTAVVLVGLVALARGAAMDGMRRRELRRLLADPLVEAAKAGDVAEVRRLLDRGADVDSIVNGRFPWTPLMHAAFEGREGVARLLLDRGADPDREDLDSFRAITLAAGEGHWGIVRLLIERGADAAAGDGHGKTPLDYAREARAAEMVRMLEGAGTPSRRRR